MDLRSIIETYRKLAGGFGQPVPMAAFGWSREETEQVFSLCDEDYHISRFFQFTLDPQTEPSATPIVAYKINGFAQTHVTIDAAIEAIL